MNPILIQCERDQKTKITPSTCIARQRILAKGSGKNSWAAVQYRDCENTCSGCNTGLELYQKFLNGENAMITEKICEGCKRSLPANLENFGPSNRAKDKLTKCCLACRGGEIAVITKRKIFKAPTDPVKVFVDEVKAKVDAPTPDAAQPLEIPVEKQASGPGKIKTKTCTCPTCKQPDKPATTEFFCKVKKYRDGLDYWCKDCQNERKRQLRGKSENTLVIDFSDCRETLEKLREFAAKQERTPEAQVRYMLKAGALVG